MVKTNNRNPRGWRCETAAAAAILVACNALGACRRRRALKKTAVPHELTEAVLHNPDMGWVVYENYPLDTDPHGSSTLLTLPDETFAGVDSVAMMFSWQDIEQMPDQYDFSKVDFAYDYWRKRGKAIQLRMSATSLMWWANRMPPTGKGCRISARAFEREREASS